MSRAKTSRTRWWYRPLTLAGVAAAALLVYLNGLSGGFVWDDLTLIVDDRAVKSWKHVEEVFTNDFFARDENSLPYGYYRPLTTLSYLMDFTVWGLKPFGYHLTNILLHAAGTLMVAVILLQLGLGFTASSLSALFFAVHPIHTENVAWIAGRTDLLAFLFCAISLFLYLLALGKSPQDAALRPEGSTHRGARTPPARIRPANRRRRRVLIGLSVLSFALALLAKEVSVVLIGWVLMIDSVAFRRRWRSTALTVVPYLTVLAVYCGWRFLVVHVTVPGTPPQHTFTAVVLSTGPTIVSYLSRMLLPIELNAYLQNPYVTYVDLRFLTSILALGGVGALIYWLSSYSKSALLLAGMLVVSFVPALNFVRVAAPPDMGNVMAERFCYFPSFPFVALVALAITTLLERASSAPLPRLLIISTVAAAISLASAATLLRNRVWANELTFLTTTLEQSPTATLLWGNLASYHLAQGNLDQAAYAINKARSLSWHSSPLRRRSSPGSVTSHEFRGTPGTPLGKRSGRFGDRKRGAVPVDSLGNPRSAISGRFSQPLGDR